MLSNPKVPSKPTRIFGFYRMSLSILKRNGRNLARTVFSDGKRKANRGILSAGKDDYGFHFFLFNAGSIGVVFIIPTIFSVIFGLDFRYSIVANDP